MYLDALLRVCSAQAFAATGVSASSIDLGVPGGVGTPPQREIGTGEPMGFGVSIGVLPTAPSIDFEIIAATDALLTAGIVSLVKVTKAPADLPAGTNFFIPMPPGPPAARYLGLRVTIASGAANGITAWLTAHSLFSITAKTYAKNYVV
jgi:hypothetical protein